MKNKCKVCTVMCDISRGNELKACAFEHNGDENICPFDARYLDLSEYEKQIRADAIEEFEKTKNEVLKWLIKRQEEGYGTSNGELLDHIYDIAKQLKEQKNVRLP